MYKQYKTVCTWNYIIYFVKLLVETEVCEVSCKVMYNVSSVLLLCFEAKIKYRMKQDEAFFVPLLYTSPEMSTDLV